MNRKDEGGRMKDESNCRMGVFCLIHGSFMSAASSVTAENSQPASHAAFCV
jgi:hypothetical protein